MLLAIPLVDQLFRHHGFSRMVRFIASTGVYKRSSVAKAAGVSPFVAWSAIKDLKRTGHISNVGCKWMEKDFIIVNLRDVAVDALFRYRGTRQLLYLASKAPVNLSEASRQLAISYSAVKKLAARLRESGILTRENRIREDLLRQPERMLDLIPRREHRDAVRFFLGESISTDPLFVYGDASWGLEVLEIDMLALVKSIDRYGEFLTDDLIRAASSTTARFGFTFDITIATLSAWFENRLTEVPNKTLLEVQEGICVRDSPPSDEDYFKYIEGAVGEERIDELLRKGYIRRTERGYVYTDKALAKFKKYPAIIKKTIVKVNGKGIKILSASIRRRITVR